MERPPAFFLSAAAILLTLSACTASPPESAGMSAISPERVVAARQAALRLSIANLSAIKGVIDRGDDPKGAEGPARALAQWANALPGLFPPGTGPGTADTKARAEIWTDRAGFEQRAADFAIASTALANSAAAGDKAALAVQWKAVGATCGACHQAYRAEGG